MQTRLSAVENPGTHTRSSDSAPHEKPQCRRDAIAEADDIDRIAPWYSVVVLSVYLVDMLQVAIA